MPHTHHDDDDPQEQRQHMLERLKKYGSLKIVLMCKNCGMLCFVREKEDIPIRCGYCLSTAIPPTFWAEVEMKDLVKKA